MKVDNFIRRRIDELRLKKNISESKLSELIGYNRSYITQITNGPNMPTFTALEAICDYFEITLSQFFDSQYSDDVSIQFIAAKLSEIEKKDDVKFIYNLLNNLDQEVIDALKLIVCKASKLKE